MIYINFYTSSMIDAITCELDGNLVKDNIDEFYEHLAEQLFAQMMGWA